MAPSKKTTVYLDPEHYRRLQALASRLKRSAAELVREAVAEYASRHTPAPLPRSLGAGRSGRKHLGSRADFYLDGMGEDP